MTAQDVLDELKAVAKPSIKKVHMSHGAREPFYGVSVEDLKKIQKRIKRDHALAIELYETGISDAMYLAGLNVDDSKMTKKDLNRWVNQASWHHQMNAFVIDVGSYVVALTDKAMEVADTLGVVKVDMGGTACNVPSARESIEKVHASRKAGKKRKTVKC